MRRYLQFAISLTVIMLVDMFCSPYYATTSTSSYVFTRHPDYIIIVYTIKKHIFSHSFDKNKISTFLFFFIYITETDIIYPIRRTADPEHISEQSRSCFLYLKIRQGHTNHDLLIIDPLLGGIVISL